MTAIGDPPSVVERSKQLGLSVNFLPGRVEKLTLPHDSQYDAVVVDGQLHFIPTKPAAELIIQLKQHTRLNGFHLIRALGRQTPRASDPTKTSLMPWLEWYSDWRIIQFTYRDNDISSRYADSPHWLFDHQTSLLAKRGSPTEKIRQLYKDQK